MPTSKPMNELLARTRPELWVLDGDAGWREPALLPATFLHADPADDRSRARDAPRRPAAPDRPGRPTGAPPTRAAGEALGRWLAALDEPFEGAAVPGRSPTPCPDGAVLWVGSSMPVRDLDAWLPSTDRAIPVRSSRGANGIDGVVSAAGRGGGRRRSGRPGARRRLVPPRPGRPGRGAAPGLSATIVLVNNDGGGIFSFLSQAQPARPDRVPASRSTSSSCSGRRMGSTSGRSSTALGRRAPGRRDRRTSAAAIADPSAAGRAGPRAAAPTGRGTWQLHRERPRPSRRRSPGWCRERRSSSTASAGRSASRGSGRPLLLLHGFTGSGADWGRRAGLRPRLPRRSRWTCPATAARGTGPPAP